MTLGDQNKLLGTTNLLWSSLDCALLWYKNNFADLLWRIWVLRPTERETHTHTRTHPHNFSEGKKRNKRDEELQNGPEFGCVFCLRYEKKNLTTTITTPQLENTVFLWFFLPLLHLCFWVLIFIYFCGGRWVWKSC